MFISLMLFITVFVPLVCYLALKKKPFIFSVYYYFTFSISIVLIECIELSFKLFFCLLAYHVQLSIGPQEQWINQVLMKIKTWRVSTATYKLYTHLTTFPHDQLKLVAYSSSEVSRLQILAQIDYCTKSWLYKEQNLIILVSFISQKCLVLPI